MHQHIQTNKQSNRLAVAGLILGIIACVFAFIPVLLLSAPLLTILAVGPIISMVIPLVLIGIPMSAVGLSKANKMGGSGKGTAVAGLVLQIGAILIMILWSFAIAKEVSEIPAI